jgi:DNA-binding CsgD family transcriptional regulator
VSRTADPERAVRAVARATGPLEGGGADHLELRRAAAGALRGQLGFDVAVWATLDPVTAMWTSCLLDGMDRDAALEAAVFANEYGQRDVLKLVDLARTGRSATALEATAGSLTRSARHRELLGPAGVTDELRVVLTDGTTPWGAVLLLRTSGAFDDADRRCVDAVARPLALALRSALVSASGPGSAPASAGMVLCAPDGAVRALTEEASALLGLPAGADPAGAAVARLPQVLASVLASHRAGGAGTATAPAADGRWLSFTATALAGTDAVVVEQLPAHRLADLVVRGRGLTPRERDVLVLVAGGRSNAEAARTLGISAFTVGDHVKALFAKLGASSRSELAAALFADAFAPLHTSAGA